jgi:hypothetical protein
MAKKNNASDTINKATPIFKPFCTANVWLPMKVPSDITSLNQNDILDIHNTTAKARKNSAPLNPCMVETNEVVSVNKLTQVNKGQGEGDTR